MPLIWNRVVGNYKVDVFSASTLNYTRSIRLTLPASGGDPAHTVSIRFPTSVAADNVEIGTTFSSMELGYGRFDDFYRLLQTEKPVYFTAYEFGTTRFVGLSTDAEALGEGFRDSDAAP